MSVAKLEFRVGVEHLARFLFFVSGLLSVKVDLSNPQGTRGNVANHPTVSRRMLMKQQQSARCLSVASLRARVKFTSSVRCR